MNEGDVVFQVDAFQAAHVMDVVKLVKDTDNSEAISDRLLDLGVEYFGRCLTAARYLQCEEAAELLKKALAKRINLICSYSYDTIDVPFFDKKSSQLKVFLQYPYEQEFDQDQPVSNKEKLVVYIEIDHNIEF